MEKLIIFYDDTKAGCCRCVSRFETYENVECRKASDYKDKTLIFATGAKVGFVFESENGKVPYAIRSATKDMEKRGYHVRYIYTRYMLEKYKVKEEDAIEWMLTDIQTGQIQNDIKEKYAGMTKKEARKELLRELRAYGRFRRKSRKK